MPNEITMARRSLAPATFGEAIEFSRMLAKSDMVPAPYRNKPENVLLAIQWGMEVGLGPLQAIQNIAVINGKPSVYGDALLGMVRGSPVCEDVNESFEGDDDHLTAVCVAKRRGAAPVTGKFSVADAKKAGLWNKQGPWQQYPRRMLQMRARGFALRDAFPDVLRGVITREEAADYPAVGRYEPIDITPAPADTRAELDRFAAAKPAEIVDESTGEVFGAAAIERDAESAAAKGTDAFRNHVRSLSREERASLNGKIGTAANPGEILRIAIRADERKLFDEDFGPPEPDEPHPNSPAGDGHNGNHHATERSRAVADTADNSSGPAVGSSQDEPNAAPAGEPPRARDDAWWNREQVAIAVKTSREFQLALHQRLRECRNWAEVERLRDDNPMIDTLDKATKQDVLVALADREKELRNG